MSAVVLSALGRATTAAAQASPPAPIPPFLVAAGSEATHRLSGVILAEVGGLSMPAQLTAAVTVPSDPACGEVSYTSTGSLESVIAPCGGDAARAAPKRSVAGLYPDAVVGAGRGCIDIARSAMGPRPVSPESDSAAFEYFAFGLDAVSWATTSLRAPIVMSVQDLRAIYDCAIVDWGALPGGVSGPIRRALPPRGSDTRELFLRHVLAVDPDYTFPTGIGCPAVKEFAENNGRTLAGATHLPDFDAFILPFSSARWVYQATNRINPTLDQRNGVRLGAITRDPIDPCPSVGALPAVQATSEPTFTVNHDGASYQLNSATVICGVSRTAASDALLDTSLVGAEPGTFVQSMVGLTVSGSIVYPGTGWRPSGGVKVDGRRFLRRADNSNERTYTRDHTSIAQ